MRALQAQQLSHVTYWSFLGWQLLLGPSLLLALAGVIALLRPPLKDFRVIGLACAAAFTTVFLLRGKGYYVGPVYPTLFAAGAVWLAQLGAGAGAMLFQAALLTAVFLFDAMILPIGLPVLPKERMARYAAAIGIAEATRTNQGRSAAPAAGLRRHARLAGARGDGRARLRFAAAGEARAGGDRRRELW